MKREDFNDNFTQFITTVMKRAAIFFEDEAIAKKLLHKSYITGLKQLSRYNDNEDFKIWFAKIMGKQYRQNIKQWKAESKIIHNAIVRNKNPRYSKKREAQNYYLTKQTKVNLYRFNESIPKEYRGMIGNKKKGNEDN